MNIHEIIKVLSQMPQIIKKLIHPYNEKYLLFKPNNDSFSVFDVIGHFIEGEKHDWIPRMNIILSEVNHVPFTSFDRFAQFENSAGKSIQLLLEEFTNLRAQNITKLLNTKLSKKELERTGMHPELGEVNLNQLIHTWMIHDLNHLNQVTRILSKQFTENVGPWHKYLSVLH